MEISGAVSTQAVTQPNAVNASQRQVSHAAGVPLPDRTAVAHAVQETNKRLTDASTAVVFDMDTTSHRVWLNVVDKTTGKVVSELPPEAVRKLVDSYAVAGLSVDKLR